MSLSLKKITSLVLRVKNLDTLVAYNVLRAHSTWWGCVPMGPPDVILGISEAYKEDKDKNKVNLGVGAYRDDEGKPWILPSVRKAEDILYKKAMNHEYGPIGGEEVFCDAVAKLAFGECSPVVLDRTNTTVQTISGTGALRLGFEFLTQHFPYTRVVNMSSPTWGNHPQICATLRIPVKTYRYYNKKTNGFDLEGALEDICQMDQGSIILLHACAHNPTGVDPKIEQWHLLSQAIAHRQLIPFFDMAYQGFATGDIHTDAAAVRLFVQSGHQVMLAQSFAKNMGLYGERVGTLTFLCGNQETRDKMMSQAKITIRTLYSSPPLYCARIVTEILTTPELKKQWLCDVKTMADRIITMRTQLRKGIESLGNKNKWQHITDQIGMFCYTGLKPEQVQKLTKEHHIYLTKDGRISIAGISSKNVKYVSNAIHKVSS